MVVGIFAVVVVVVIAIVALYCFLKKPSQSLNDSEKNELFKIYDTSSKDNVAMRLNESFSGFSRPTLSFNREVFQQQHHEQPKAAESVQLYNLFGNSNDPMDTFESQENPARRNDEGGT